LISGLTFGDAEAMADPSAEFWLLMEAAGQIFVLLASSRARRSEDLRCIDIFWAKRIEFFVNNNFEFQFR
jgi:hypothetical protein